MENSNSNKFIVPGAIIIAGLIIAGAVYYSQKTPAKSPGANQPSQNQAAAPAAPPLNNLKPVTGQDHILGNPNAPATLVLYTDLVCPFCKRFHMTMKQMMDEYGKAGRLKWVVRPLPLESLHPKAKGEAVAAECAADLGGNEKFFAYIDRIFETAPAEGFDAADLVKIADYIGLGRTQFEQCLNSGKFDQKINDSIQSAINTGAQGTPFSIVIGPNGKKTVIPGALPYEQVKQAIDEMLK